MDDTVIAATIPDLPPPETTSLLDAYLPDYEIVLTEHVVVDADPGAVFAVAQNFDFLTTNAPLVTALMFIRSVPSRLRRQSILTPPSLFLARDPGVLTGWLLMGAVPGREVVFGAVGTFWKPEIEWHDVRPDQFATFAEPGWGKIACHLLVRPAGPGRSVLSYECRTATTDPASRTQMSRYWWLIRPFVAYIMRAVLRTIRTNVNARD